MFNKAFNTRPGVYSGLLAIFISTDNNFRNQISFSYLEKENKMLQNHNLSFFKRKQQILFSWSLNFAFNFFPADS